MATSQIFPSDLVLVALRTLQNITQHFLAHVQ